jgi:hypothetical protein
MAMSAEQFMRHHRLDVYLKDVAVSGCQQAVADEDFDAFQAEYFQTVAQGHHVIGRDYAFVTSAALAESCEVKVGLVLEQWGTTSACAGTQYNRTCFCNHARQALEQCASVGELSIVDLQSILQFICPDFPLGVVRSVG